jgi:hypothetical protein
MDERLRLIIFAHPRSGSSSLYQILNLHPHLHLLEEPFHEHFTQWYPHEPNYLAHVHDTTSLDTQLAAIFTRYNGMKVLHYQLPPPLYTHMLRNPAYMVIFLRRRNLLQAVVSVLLAEQTHLWKKWDMDRPLHDYYANLAPLSIPQIHHHMIFLKRSLDLFEDVLATRPAGSYLKLTYEDLYLGPAEQRAAGVERIWRFLELEPVQGNAQEVYLDPEQAKINSPATYHFLPNAEAINRQLGSDETGWLL